MPAHGTETEFELTTIQRLKGQFGPDSYTHGCELDRESTEVVLRDVLRQNLATRYPDLPDDAIDKAVRRFAVPDGADTLRRNRAFHRDLTKGYELEFQWPDGTDGVRQVYAVDWNDVDANDFMIVNQLSISGKNDRRPDVVIYVNGLPLVLFELKNPYSEQPTVDDALNQIGHYRHDISQIFEFNALTIVSDGVTTLHGMWTAGGEWYAPWKSIDGVNVETNTTGSIKTLVEGLLTKDRLLSYIRDFIVFENANDKIIKKGAKYHQFFAVHIAAEKAIASLMPSSQPDALAKDSEKRVGVIWHTTGSGKSLSMTFLVGMLRRQEGMNPTFVIQVDRTDLDDQLHDQFVGRS